MTRNNNNSAAFISVLVLAFLALVSYWTGVPFMALLDSAPTLLPVAILVGVIAYFTQYKVSAIWAGAALFWYKEGEKLMLAKANPDLKLWEVPISSMSVWDQSAVNTPWYSLGWTNNVLALVFLVVAIYLFTKEND